MKGLEQVLFRLGIPTYIQSIYVDFPLAAQPVINLPKQLPTQIGWCYGISTDTQGVTPDNTTLITTVEADALYLVFKAGASEFQKSIRMQKLIFAANVEQRYLPINIPYTVSLDQSYLQNPTGIVSAVGANKQAKIDLWYIDKKSYITLRKSGYLLANGVPPEAEKE